MALSPEIKRLLQQTLKIRDSQVPLHRIIDILATDDGDVSTAVNRFRDVKNQELRRAFHQCALLLRELEREAGMTPKWEQSSGTAPGKSQPNEGKPVSSAPAKTAAVPKAKFRPEELRIFENQDIIGQVRMAKVYVDGASKGNPGEAGIGVAMFGMDGQKVGQLARAIGLATNNIAEYTSLIEALQMGKRLGIKVLHAISDSELMVNQMNGIYKIKNPDILKKVQEAKALTKAYERFTISYVGREHNALADALSTMLIKKKTDDKSKSVPAGGEASGEDDGYRDLMGNIDELADDGRTE